MKKKAKFVIEIEYENDGDGFADDRGINVVEYTTEGDYRGLTLALTTGLGFATKKHMSNKEKFVDKLRLMRAAASAFVSIFGTINRIGALGEDAVSPDLEKALMAAVKKLTDLTTLGIGVILGVDEQDVIDANKEYDEIHKQNTDEQEGKSDTQGSKGVNLDDII